MLLASQEQPIRDGFTSLTEQRQFAKSGIADGISDNVTPDGNRIALALKSDPWTGTIGALLVTGGKSAEAKIVAVATMPNDPQGSTPADVAFWDATNASGATGVTAALAVTGMVKSGELTFDNGSLNNDSVTNAVANGTGISTLLNGAIATRKPSFSVQSLVNQVEDQLAAYNLANPGTIWDALIVMDQNTGKVTVMTGTPAHVGSAYDAFTTAANTAMGDVLVDTDLDRTAQSATEKQFGE